MYFFKLNYDIVPEILDELTDEEFKKEAKNESKNDAISAIIKAMKNLIPPAVRREAREDRGNIPSSPDGSSDSSTSSPHHPYDDPNIEAENSLPGVVMSQRLHYVTFFFIFFQLADLRCTLKHSQLRDAARNLLQLIPPHSHGSSIAVALWPLEGRGGRR
ncbi:hypothetical protein KQX54_012112 [Cotesia glomerata]|uniref:Uncharacterized protein n=1 Tax=Cotesia glomerata TaxID=32391 RepID=A0AAV7I2Z3_COTGL|nr:hypothetical protein KQX54_012112 [Cotesia glomerata]